MVTGTGPSISVDVHSIEPGTYTKSIQEAREFGQCIEAKWGMVKAKG